ncbi:GGDEF domain-containing protein [Geothermobacter hydrogeniphilus]|uniref:GGDEF domain-containing protein n=1 Tax=Geothermobacter hydrogeniphilus TaxID=1969733 RepID=UPI001304DC8B|nr:diguanylate cyclase [Geothermobacter hydrogeniphilus]
MQLRRWGGEEFLILLPATPCREACVTAEKLSRRIAATPCPETGAPLTASSGVAAITLKDSGENLVERADRGLYRSKKDGRNRVTFLDPISDESVNPALESPPDNLSQTAADLEK